MNGAKREVYETVLFADNYFQKIGCLFKAKGCLLCETLCGTELPNAYNRELKTLSGEGDCCEHSDVPLWYHGTINLGPTASNGSYTITSQMRDDWWGAGEHEGEESGYYFSRIVGGNRGSNECLPDQNCPDCVNQPSCPNGVKRVRDGLHRLLSGAADRVPLAQTSATVWPNIITFRLETPSVHAGNAASFRLTSQDLSDSYDIDVFLDEDHNPYNGHITSLGGLSYDKQNSFSDINTAIQAHVIPINQSPGSFSCYAMISDGDGHARYLYSQETLTVLPAITNQVCAQAGLHGSIQGPNCVSLVEGGFHQFCATPDLGYQVASWYLNGNIVQEGGNCHGASGTSSPQSFYVTFEQTPAAGSISVLSPNGGVYDLGSRIPINWSWEGSVGDQVKIDLLLNGSFNSSVQVTANDGSYSWDMPNDQTLGNNYQIRISSLSMEIIGTSPNFEIANVPTPSVICISSLQDLKSLSENWGDAQHPRDGHYILTNDIDADDSSTWNGGLGFDPIGSNGVVFLGTFDGNGHTIIDLRIERPSEGYVGFFTVVREAAVIRNLTIQYDNFHGRGQGIGNDDGAVGGIAAWNEGLITGCNVICSQGSDIRGYGGSIGGVVGENRPTGRVLNCNLLNGEVDGRFNEENGRDSDEVGGVVGLNTGLIRWCSSMGSNIDADIGEAQGRNIGGIAGGNYGGSIRECYSSIGVDGYLRVGGIAGENSQGGMIEDCYYSGTSLDADGEAGGIVGENSSSVLRCYSSVSVVDANNGCDGLLAGESGGTIENCFWNTTLSGLVPVGCGSQPTNSFGKTDTQMKQQVTFTGWDFGGVWKVNEGIHTPEQIGVGTNLLPPTGVSASQDLSTGILVSWNPMTFSVAGQDCQAVYQVYRSDIETEACSEPLSNKILLTEEWLEGQTSFADSSAAAETDYLYYVRAAATTTGARISDYSAYVEGIRTIPPVEPPENVQASDDNPGGIVVCWDSVENANYYRVYRSEGESPPEAISGWQSDLCFNDTSVTQGQSYTYYIRAAIDENGGRESGNSAPTQGIEPQPTPTITLTPTLSPTETPPPTFTFTASPTPSHTPEGATPTNTATATATPGGITGTATFTPTPTPETTPTCILGDLDGDCDVDAIDLLIFIQQFQEDGLNEVDGVKNQ